MAAGARPLLVAALALLLAACGTTPSKKSVYYQDDGPPDRVPADVAAIPDAVPRIEPPHRGSSKPYTALGRTYTPLSGDVAFSQRGMASWYGRQFHGNRTANGELYDMLGMTAAHPILPLPSYVRVTNVRNGRSVIVRVNDRGPFKHDRVIDLSYAAAAKLGIASAGTGEVEIERITTAQIASGDYRRGSGPSSTLAAAPAAKPRTGAPVQPSPPASTAVAAVNEAAGATPAPAPAELPREASMAAEQARGWSVPRRPCSPSLTPPRKSPCVRRGSSVTAACSACWSEPCRTAIPRCHWRASSSACSNAPRRSCCAEGVASACAASSQRDLRPRLGAAPRRSSSAAS